MKEFVVIYDWDDDGMSVHRFDTIEEALKDRECYVGGEGFPIYQLVKEARIYYLPDGERFVIQADNE